MSKELTLAKHYFELSNQSDFENITELFDESSTFCTRNNEYFIGAENIMRMQRLHHGLYKKLNWSVNDVEEVKPGVICFDFSFEGMTQTDELVQITGIEVVIIQDGIIRHIDVRSK